MTSRCIFKAILASPVLLLLACASASDEGSSVDGVTGGCTPGDVADCACTNGSFGQQMCNASGIFDACVCASAPGGGSFGTGGTGTTGGTFGGSGGSTFPPPPTGGSAPVPPPPPPGTGEPPPPPPGTGEPPPPPPPPGEPTPPGSKNPVIPPVTAQCPPFVDSTINFMGLGGIQIVAGPKAAGPTAPMVFYWHGTGSTAGEFAFMAAAVRQGVVSEGGVLVSFQGTTGGDLSSGTSIFGAGDWELTDQLVACAVRDHNIDPRRIFTTGCSAGGLFAGAMAARRSNYIAAAAPNSGGWVVPAQWQSDFTPALMTMHGAPGRDVVVVDFSNTSATADQAFKARGGFVINCNHGGGHCGASGLAGDVWQFFKAHPYGVDPHPWVGGLPAGFSSSCKIY